MRPASAAAGMLLWALSAAGAETALEKVRVLTTESNCFEYLFTGVMNDADGKPLLSFNYRNGRTTFAKPGDSLGRYRIAAYESRTNRVYHASLNTYLDEPAGRVTLTGAGKEPVVLEQDRRLPWPGLMAWLVRLDNGAWWNIQEPDIFLMSGQSVAVEEIGEDGVTVTAGGDLQFIPPISPEEKKQLTQLWADLRRQEQEKRELALQRQREAAKSEAAGAAGGTSIVIYEQGPHVEVRGPTRLFCGNEYRFPTEFKACPPMVMPDGRVIQPAVVFPTRFETRFSGVSLTVP